MSALPIYISRQEILRRLPIVFPEGTPNRNILIRELTASTIFCMLYIGAVEGSGIYLAPKHVYKMSMEQSKLADNESRIAFREKVLRAGFEPVGKRWYADNTREPIRDETLREGLIQIGVVISLPIPTTSSKPRYTLKSNFAQLFNPEVEAFDLKEKIQLWQNENLSKSALTRLSLASLGKKAGLDRVLITYPNGETRHLSPGPSSEITKAVIEVFSKSFLEDPVVLWLSESGNKVISRDDNVATSIGLKIESQKNLPDIILVDLAPSHPLIVFVEVVATDGAMTERRQNALFEVTDSAQFNRSNVTFLTAYLDRESPGFKKTIHGLAWNSYIWFVSEPEKIIILRDGTISLSKLVEINKET